jgi:hypothetical protein
MDGGGVLDVEGLVPQSLIHLFTLAGSNFISTAGLGAATSTRFTRLVYHLTPFEPYWAEKQ